MKWVKIKDLLDIRKGKKAEEVDRSDLRYIQIEDLRGNENMKYCSHSDSNVLCNEDDILIAWDGANAGTVGYGVEGVIGSTIARLRPKVDHFISDYIGLFLQSKFDFFQRTATGATIPHVSREALENIKIPLPSLSEQKAIVAKLDRAQRLIDIDREMLAKYDELIQSVFLEMFGDPVTNPKGWEVMKLGELTTKVGSGSTPRGGSKIYQNHGITFIRSQNVLMNRLELVDVAYISDEIHEGMKNTWVEENDVLLNITGASIGRVCVYNKSETANVNQHVCILRPDQEEIAPYYLSHLISSRNYQNRILSQQTGGTRQAFNMTQIKNFDIPLPPMNVQIKYNGLLTTVKNEIQNLEMDLKKSQELFSSLLQEAFG